MDSHVINSASVENKGAWAVRSVLAGSFALSAMLLCSCSSSTTSSTPDSSTGAHDGAGLADDGASDAGLSITDGTTVTDADAGPAGPRWIGRVDLSDPAAPQFAWSGTGFVATVAGATISVKLKTVSSSDPVYFQPVIDGTAGSRFSVTGEQTVTLATGLASGDHVVEVYRETEGRYGHTVFEGFPDGTVKAPPPSPGRIIEIVGDSISAGYGDLGSEQHPNYGPDPDGGCPFTTATESAYTTYGAITARTLGADPSIIAMSGWGMYRDNQNNVSNVVPAVYADTLGPHTTPSWPFQPPLPQVVVINLGTNDFAMGDPGATAFEGAYTAFIATVRSKYPDAWIFCTVGPLLYGSGLAAAQTDIQAVVANAQNDGGDMKVQYLDFGQQNTSLGTGCQYHPNTTEHQAMADSLVAAIRTALGW